MYANIMIPSNEITDSNDESAPKFIAVQWMQSPLVQLKGSNIAVSVGTILIAVIALVYIVNAFLGDSWWIFWLRSIY
jgi:nucleoside permease NupC